MGESASDSNTAEELSAAGVGNVVYVSGPTTDTPGYTGFVQFIMEMTLPAPLERASALSVLPRRKEACISPLSVESSPERYTIAYCPGSMDAEGSRHLDGSAIESER